MTLLIGRVDTQQEVEAILTVLRQDSRLRIEASNMQIWQAWNALQKNRRLNQIDGPVDTPREVELFLDMLRKSKMISGPIDTLEEVKLFMQKLQEKGILLAAIANVKHTKPPEIPESPLRKKKKRRYDEDYKDRP